MRTGWIFIYAAYCSLILLVVSFSAEAFSLQLPPVRQQHAPKSYHILHAAEADSDADEKVVAPSDDSVEDSEATGVDADLMMPPKVNGAVVGDETGVDDTSEPADLSEEDVLDAIVNMSDEDSAGPSDTAEATLPPTSPVTPNSDKNVLFLQSLGAITNRGEFATPSQKEAAASVIAALEAQPQPENGGSAIFGSWELVYTNTQLFRASPFFLAGRATCTTPEQAQQYDWFCQMHRKALAISQVRAVRQIVSSDKLVSEFEVEAGSIPFVSSYSGGLPVTITGAIVSSADLTFLDNENRSWELFMDTVEIKGSNLPLLRQLLDSPGAKLPTRSLSNAIQQVFSEYSAPKPNFRTTYCSEQFRISRDQDDNVFVYVKTSESTEPSDYSSVDSDLGLLGLLEGVNDSILKIFI